MLFRSGKLRPCCFHYPALCKYMHDIRLDILEYPGIMLITHYTRILKYIKPDIVHVFAQGRVVETAGPELADELEESGYDRFLPEGADSESALA